MLLFVLFFGASCSVVTKTLFITLNSVNTFNLSTLPSSFRMMQLDIAGVLSQHVGGISIALYAGIIVWVMYVIRKPWQPA